MSGECAFLAHAVKCGCGHYCYEHVVSDLGYVVCLQCGHTVSPEPKQPTLRFTGQSSPHNTQATLHYVEGRFRQAADTRPL